MLLTDSGSWRAPARHTLPAAFWEVVGGAAAAVFADDWRMARDSSGAWFEIGHIDA